MTNLGNTTAVKDPLSDFDPTFLATRLQEALRLADRPGWAANLWRAVAQALRSEISRREETRP